MTSPGSSAKIVSHGSVEATSVTLLPGVRVDAEIAGLHKVAAES